MKRRTILLLMALMLVITLATGCKKTDSLVGKWYNESEDVELEFYKDGRLKITDWGDVAILKYEVLSDTEFIMGDGFDEELVKYSFDKGSLYLDGQEFISK